MGRRRVVDELCWERQAAVYLDVMDRDARRMRGDGPFVFAQVKHGVGVETIVDHVLAAAAASKNG